MNIKRLIDSSHISSSLLNRAELTVVFGVLLAGAQIQANVLTWSGGGGTGNWSNSANWGGAGTPNNGDTVVFPAGKPRLSNTNDISALILGEIAFTGSGGGYDIYGNAFTLTNSIAALNTSGINTIIQDVALTTTNVTVDVAAGATLVLDGDLSGGVGLIKTGTGTLNYSGSPANTYLGTTWVNTGTLILNRNGFNNSLAGPLIISDGASSALVQLAQSFELPGSAITVNQGGTLDVNGHSDRSGTLITLNGNGSITTESGSLTLAPNTTVNANPGSFENDVISGNLNVATGTCTFDVTFDLGALNVTAAVSGSATINIVGDGYMDLDASNSFTGALNILDSSVVTIDNDYSLGATNSGVMISNTAVLDISAGLYIYDKGLTNASADADGSIVVQNANDIVEWTGPITLTGTVSIEIATNSLFYAENVVGGSGGITEIGPGALVLFGPGNTYTGTTTVMPGSILYLWTAAKAVSGNLTVGGTVNCLANTQLSTFTDLDIEAGGIFHAGSFYETCGSLNGNGTLDLGTVWVDVANESGFGCEFDGAITNTGDFYVQYGTVTLTGDNTYTGTTHDWEGYLIVNGYQPQSPMDVEYNGLLSGTGVVGVINASGGTLSPGNTLGILSSSAVSLTNGSFYYAYLSGSTPGIGYGQLDAGGGGNINITGANLFVIPNFGADDGPTNGQQFVIVNNTTGHPIIGTFSGLADGAIYTAGNGMQFRVGYNEVSQNIVLTYTNPPSQQVNLAVSSGNGNGYMAPNECANLYVGLQNPGSNALTGVSAVLRSLTPGVSVTQAKSPYADLPAGGVGTNMAPFQVYTMPWLACTTNVTLQATFTTTSAGTFSVPFTFQTGAPLQFDNLSTLAIPSSTVVTSAIPVSGLSAPVAKVDVLMYINYSYDSDLVVDLIAPDGTDVNLISHNGQNNENFGSACGSPGTETVFDDYAATSISTGAAPFVGTFRPASPLSALIGKSVASVNNAKWDLRVNDTQPGDSGALECWSLRIWPGACPDGGGVCELCPNTTIYGILGATSPIEQRLTRVEVATTCAAPTTCPFEYGETDPYDAYTFRNGPTEACITVTLNSPTADQFSAAFLSSFDPNETCSNYLADAGSSTLEDYPYGIVSYSFDVAADAVFIVTVNGVGGSGGPYALSVTGGSCQPVLSINPAGTKNIALSWPTGAGGYLLESTNQLPATPGDWQTVTNPPLVTGGQFVLTNTNSGADLFFRLRKPQ